MKILEIKDLSLEKDGKRILDGISLDLEAGKTYALVGPNGAGKSSLAYALMGLDGYQPTGGDILFEGRSIKKLGVSKRAQLGITLAWQEPARFQGLLVSDLLLASAGGDAEEAEASLELVGLEPEKYLPRAVDKTLSGGERKRIELASIVCMKPRLVLLDEPDSGVDVEAMERMFDSIDYLERIGTTIILITHNLRVLKRADSAYLLCEGRVIDQSENGDAAQYFRDRCLKCPHQNKEKGGNI
jgi:Fe-S cluster assembly ATP-binding protein